MLTWFTFQRCCSRDENHLLGEDAFAQVLPQSERLHRLQLRKVSHKMWTRERRNYRGSLTSTWKPCLSRGKGRFKKKWKSFMTFAIKGGGSWVPLSFSRPQKQVFFVQKHWQPFLVCFENGKWKKVSSVFSGSKFSYLLTVGPRALTPLRPLRSAWP